MVRVQLASLLVKKPLWCGPSSHRFLLPSFALYLALFLGFESGPKAFQKQGLFTSHGPHPEVIARAKDLTNSMDNMSLGLNFLANSRELPQKVSQDFERSGLAHLLAISGGQITPMTQLLTSLSLKLYLSGLRTRLNSVKLLHTARKLKILMTAAVTFFLPPASVPPARLCA